MQAVFSHQLIVPLCRGSLGNQLILTTFFPRHHAPHIFCLHSDIFYSLWSIFTRIETLYLCGNIFLYIFFQIFLLALTAWNIFTGVQVHGDAACAAQRGPHHQRQVPVRGVRRGAALPDRHTHQRAHRRRWVQIFSYLFLKYFWQCKYFWQWQAKLRGKEKWGQQAVRWQI